ncbi:MAG: hypothetical protein ACQERZ_03740 [Fusobacteriota bacterium]
MKKIIGIILVILALGTGLYINYCNTDPSIFITEDTNMFVYGEKDIKLEEEFKDIEKLMLENGVIQEDGYDELKELDKYIQKSFFISKIAGDLKTKSLKDMNILMGLNVGNYYLPFRSNLYKYFDKTNLNNYKLKEQYIKSFTKGLKEADKTGSFEGIEDLEIFLKPIKSYFLISFSEKKIIDHLEKMKKNKLNQELISEYEKMKSKNKNFGIVDFKQIYKAIKQDKNTNYSNKVRFLKTYYNYDYKSERLKVFMELEGEDEIFTSMDSEKIENRKLTEFVDQNRLYFSNNSFSNISKKVLEEIKKEQGIDYNQLSKMFLGAQIPELIDDLGNEILFDYSNFDKLRLMSNLKNRSRFEKTLNKLGISKQGEEYIINPNLKLIPQENHLFINDVINKADKNIEIPKDSFLYSKVNLEDLDKNNDKNLNNFDFSNIEFEITGKSSDESLKFELDISKKAIKKMIILGLEISNKGE